MTLRPIMTATALAGLVLALMTGCTAPPAVAPGSTSTTRPVAATRFSCPTGEEVAALTALPLERRRASATVCTYGTAAGAERAASVTLRHPGSPAASTLTALRSDALRRGERTEDLPSIAFDAFTAVTGARCTAWFDAVDGVTTSVTATSAAASSASATAAATTRTPSSATARATASCAVAGAVASLAGTESVTAGSTPTASATSGSATAGSAATGSATGAPIISVLAPRRLLGTTTSQERWPFRIGEETGGRIYRAVGSGYDRPSTASSFAGLAHRIPTGSAVVVLVSGVAEAGETRLAVLSDVTAALSAARLRAPGAELVVVGPVSAGTTPTPEVDALRSALQAAAAIARARFVDPPAPLVAGSTTSAALEAVAGRIADEVRPHLSTR